MGWISSGSHSICESYIPLSPFKLSCGSCNRPTPSNKLGTFDLIVSFEIIEHVEVEGQFLKNIYKILNTGGTLILLTPFRRVRGMPCGSHFHVHQFTVLEFMSMFPNYMDTTFFFEKGC
ncbi:methyltransferase domain-containing protein [Bacillaceae bacterium S4-13-58]